MAKKTSNTADNLQKAIAEVQGGQARSMRAAALKYGIPKSTLHDHLSRHEANMLKIFPIILFRTSKKFHLLFLHNYL